MSVIGAMLGNAYRTSRNLILLVALAVSLLWNAATMSVGALSTMFSAAIEAATGIKTVTSQLLTKEKEAVALRAELAAAKKAASKAEGTAVGRGLMLAEEKAAKVAAQQELNATEKLASKWEGKALGTALTLEQEKIAKSQLLSEVTALRSVRKITVDGVETTVEDAVLQATRRVRDRTAKLAATDLSATVGQAIPWIGVSVVVAATVYDLNSSCATMRDMRSIEAALNPSVIDGDDVDRVCGLRVPSEEEIWQAIKSSPGIAWSKAKGALGSLPSMPTMPELAWPSLPDIGLPDSPNLNWRIWEESR